MVWACERVCLRGGGGSNRAGGGFGERDKSKRLVQNETCIFSFASPQGIRPPMPPHNTPLPPGCADEADVWRERGNALARTGAWGEAATAYTRSLDARPTAAAAANRAAARLKLGDCAGAVDDATLALSFDPHHLKSLERRAAAATVLGRHAEAARDYDAALRLAPGDEPLARGRAAALAALAAEKGLVCGSGREVEVTVGSAASAATAPMEVETKTTPVDAPANPAPDPVAVAAAAAASDAVALLKRGGGVTSSITTPSLRSVADIEAALLRGETAPDLEAAVVAALAARPPPQLAAALTPALVAAVARAALRVAARVGAHHAAALLQHVARAPTFGMAVLCLSPGDKQGVGEAWDCAARGVTDAGAAAALAAVRREYGV